MLTRRCTCRNLEANKLSALPRGFTGEKVEGYVSLTQNNFAPSNIIKIQENLLRVVIDHPSDGLRVSGTSIDRQEGAVR